MSLAEKRDDSTAEKMAWQRAGSTGGCWAGRKGDLKAVQTEHLTVEKLALPRVGSSDVLLVVRMACCWVDYLAAPKVGCWVDSSDGHWAASSDVLMAGCWAGLWAEKTVLHLVERTVAN